MPYDSKWSPWDNDLKDDVNWSQAKMRLNKPPRKANRVTTHLQSVDDVLGGGLPEGLTILYGHAGTGKSMFAKTVAKKFVQNKQKVLYFFGEDSFDSPVPIPPYLNNVDMVSYRPGPPKAVRTVLKFVQEMRPDLVIFDSLTTILGATSKAVPEADVREWTGTLAAKLSGIVPAIGISEVRGSGQYLSPAGGWGVAHAGLQTILFKKHIIESKWDAQDWHAEFGAIIYTMHVEKDRDGQSRQGRVFRANYLGDDLFLEAIEGGGV
jgi:predicted ATP-dependent serine protease